MGDIKKAIITGFTNASPNNWNDIKRTLTNQLVTDLLKSLEVFSDPQGKELIDLRYSHQLNIKKINKKGA